MSNNYIDANWLESSTLDELLEEAKTLRWEMDTINEQLSDARSNPEIHELSWFIKAQGAARVKFIQVQTIEKKIDHHKREQQHRHKMEEKAQNEAFQQARADARNRRKIEVQERHERIVVDHLQEVLGREKFRELIEPIAEKLKSLSDDGKAYIAELEPPK